MWPLVCIGFMAQKRSNTTKSAAPIYIGILRLPILTDEGGEEVEEEAGEYAEIIEDT